MHQAQDVDDFAVGKRLVRADENGNVRILGDFGLEFSGQDFFPDGDIVELQLFFVFLGAVLDVCLVWRPSLSLR